VCVCVCVCVCSLETDEWRRPLYIGDTAAGRRDTGEALSRTAGVVMVCVYITAGVVMVCIYIHIHTWKERHGRSS
jgi:hypothetical protein